MLKIPFEPLSHPSLGQVAEDLLAYFLEHKAYDCFAACLFQVLNPIFSRHKSDF
jgi:hypothetical protein